MPLFYDELITLNYFVKSGLITPFNEFAQANNHTLNSALTFFSYQLFGESPFALRLPNLLSFILYAVYLYKLGMFLDSKYLRKILYISMLTILGVLDFFALSRGYGLSIALLVTSAYFTLKSYDQLSIIVVLLSLFTAFLAVLANLSLLLFLLSSIVILIVNLFRHHKRLKRPRDILLIIVSLITSSLFLWLIVDVINFYRGKNLLWWGRDGSFWDVSIVSQIKFLFNSESSIFQILVGVLVIVLLLSVIRVYKQIFKFNAKSMFFFMILSNVTGVLLLAFMMNVNYPYQRSGLHLSILFLISYPFCLDMIPGRSKILKGMLVSPLLFIPLFSLINISLTTVRFWETDSIPHKYVKAVSKKSENIKLSTIRIYGMGYASWNYQLINSDKNTPIASYSPVLNSYYDFVITHPKNMSDLSDKYVLVSHEDRLGPALYKRKVELKKIKVGSFNSDSSFVTHREYTNIGQFQLDSLQSSTLLYGIEAEINFVDFPSQQYLYINATEPNTSNLICSASICIDDIFFEPQEGLAQLCVSGFLENLPVGQSVDITISFHNTHLRTLQVFSTRIELYSIIE